MNKCPNKPGVMTNFGCPETKKEDREVLDLAVKNVNFKSGRASLTESSGT